MNYVTSRVYPPFLYKIAIFVIYVTNFPMTYLSVQYVTKDAI